MGGISHLDKMITSLESSYIDQNQGMTQDKLDQQASKIWVKFDKSDKSEDGFGLKLSAASQSKSATKSLFGQSKLDKTKSKVQDHFDQHFKEAKVKRGKVDDQSSMKFLEAAYTGSSKKTYMTLAELRTMRDQANADVANINKNKNDIQSSTQEVNSIKNSLSGVGIGSLESISQDIKQKIDQKLAEVDSTYTDYTGSMKEKPKYNDAQKAQMLKQVVKFAKNAQDNLSTKVNEHFNKVEQEQQTKQLAEMQKKQQLENAKKIEPHVPPQFDNAELQLGNVEGGPLLQSRQGSNQSCALHAINSFCQDQVMDDATMNASFKQVMKPQVDSFDAMKDGIDDIVVVNKIKPKPQDVKSGFETNSVQWQLHNLGIETESMNIDTPLTSKLTKPGPNVDISADQKAFLTMQAQKLELSPDVYTQMVFAAGDPSPELEEEYAAYLGDLAIDRAVIKLNESGADRVMLNYGIEEGTHWVTMMKDDEGKWHLLDSLDKTGDQPEMTMKEFLTQKRNLFANNDQVMRAQMVVERDPKVPGDNQAFDAFQDGGKALLFNMKSDGWYDGATVSMDKLKSDMSDAIDVLDDLENGRDIDTEAALATLRQAVKSMSDYIDNRGDYALMQSQINELQDVVAAANAYIPILDEYSK
ncbi:MAG: hypothetical protein AAGC81_01060 [Pseudomonadota bacterium]